jgi:hypothetical protein
MYFTNSYRLLTFYINMLMPKLFKHVNFPTNVISAFDKPCIPLTTCRKILFTSRNGHSRQKHDKNVWEWSHFLGVEMDFQVKEWSFGSLFSTSPLSQ